jgi:hypothetical protein
MAILPFIRQFASVDKSWFEQANYPKVRDWLNTFIESDQFKQIMPKFKQWHEQDERTLFP